jgi:MFS family permease
VRGARSRPECNPHLAPCTYFPRVLPLNPFSVLVRHRNFRLFWIGQTISLTGTWMQSMAQGWLALELTNNAFLVGLVAAAGSLPVVLLSMHAGVIADRHERLRLVKIAQSLLLLEASVLFLFTWTGHISIIWLVMLAFAQGVIGSLEIPARQSLIVELVGREDLPQAIALQSSGFNLARIIGPAIAALVIAKLGLAWAFGFNALSYFAVLISLFMVKLAPWQPTTRLVRPLEGIRELLDYMRQTPTVAALMKLVTVFGILGVPYLVLMPVFARDRLGLDADGYGLLLTCVGIGGLTGALAIAARAGLQPGTRTLAVGSMMFPATLLLLSSVTNAKLAYALLLLAGAGMIVNGAVSNSMLQQLVPDALRGRMMAAYAFVVVGLAQTVGAFIAGVVARALGAHWAIAIGSIVMLGYAFHAFRQPALSPAGTAGGRVP